MGTGYTSVLLLPAWLLRKLGAAELAQLLAEPGRGEADAAAAPAAAAAAGAPAPSPRQLARRQRRKRQRERRRASGACEGALPSDDIAMDGRSADASPQAGSAVGDAARGGGKRACSAVASASPPTDLNSSSLSVRGAAVCGGGSSSVAAPAAAGPQKRKRAGGGSVGGASGEASRVSAVEPVDHERVSALAEAVHEELVSGGVPTAQVRLRPLMLGGKLLPQFPVVRGGCAERATVAELAGSVQSVLRGVVPAFDGLRRLITEGTDYS